MATAAEQYGVLEAKRGELKALFDKHRTADGRYDMPVEVVEEANRRNEELTTLSKAWEATKSAESLATANDEALKAMRQPAERMRFSGDPEPESSGDRAALQATKSLGEFVVSHDAYKGRRHDGKFVLEYGEAVLNRLPENQEAVKTLLERTTGYVPFYPRESRVERRPPAGTPPARTPPARVTTR